MLEYHIRMGFGKSIVEQNHQTLKDSSNQFENSKKEMIAGKLIPKMSAKEVGANFAVAKKVHLQCCCKILR